MKKIYILIFLLAASSVFSQTLTSGEIIKRYISAIGGIDEIKNIKQLTLIGKAESGGVIYDLLAYEDAVAKYQFAKVTGPNYDMRTYNDTKEGWVIYNGNKTNFTSEALERVQPMIEDGTYFYLADLESRGIKTELLGEETVKGRETYKIKFTRNGKDKNIQYFDKSTFYMLKLETDSVEIYYDNYKEVPGTKLVLPYYNEKGNIKAAIDKYQINIELSSPIINGQ